MRITRLFASCLPLLAFVLGLTFQAAIAAEPAQPGSDEVLLSDLKVTAKATWQPETEWKPGYKEPKRRAPTLRIGVDFRGTAAKLTSSYGEIKLNAVVDQDGKSHRAGCTVWRGYEMRENFLQTNLAEPGPQGFQFILDIKSRPPIRLFREIRGSIALQTGGEHVPVTVRNAFAGLTAAEEENTVRASTMSGQPQWIAEPVADQSLAKHGIKLATKRRHVRPGTENAKDRVDIQIECSEPIIDCCILDADGTPIERGCSSWGHSESSWSFDFETVKPIPADAQLRLVLHKNSRKIRVPFVIQDVAVPEIKKGDGMLDVPASADDAVIEPEDVPPNDPIVDGLRLDAKAEWRPWMGVKRKPDLVVAVELQGRPAEQTSAFGEVEVDMVVDDMGKTLDFTNSNREMIARFCDSKSFKVDLKSSAPPPVKKIVELRGSLVLQTGGQGEMIAIPGFLKKIGKNGEIKDERLNGLGIVAELERKRDIAPSFGGVESLNIRFSWKRSPVVLCQVLGEDDAPLREGNSSWSWMGPRSMAWWRSFKDSLPETAQLRLFVVKNQRKVRVPFVLKNIEVPPRPEEDDDKPFTGVVPGRKNKRVPTN